MRHPAKFCSYLVGMLTLGGLSACTTIHIAGADGIKTAWLPGIAYVEVVTAPEQLVIVKRTSLGLAVHQRQLLVGYDRSDQIFAGENLACTVVMMPSDGFDPKVLATETERIKHVCINKRLPN